ncbi:MAG: hypothetical protein Q9162_001752 [Coniocarpon cinnabarinum]
MSMTSATRHFQTPFGASKRKNGADPYVLTHGVQSHNSNNDSRAMSLGAKSAASRHDDDSMRSNSLSVDLDDDGQAPAPPDLVRRRIAMHGNASSVPTTPDSRDPSIMSGETAETRATSDLPALQTRGTPGYDKLDIVNEDDPANYDLVLPHDVGPESPQEYSLEQRGQDMFSKEHLQTIFDDPSLLLKFTSYLGTHRKSSVPLLIYYLDALKALRAIKYANAVSEALDPLDGLNFTDTMPKASQNNELQEKAERAFDAMAQQDLPAFITHTFINVVSTSIQRRITGTLPPHLREASEGLAEVFCLSDPSRPDNPIVFASEEFHRTTQYGMSYAIGRNCRFLQGPSTNPLSVRRIATAVKEGRDHSETFVNYRRDGSPFLNLLMVAPLRDSRGNLRYYIGAQVDVSGLAKDCTDLPALQRMLEQRGQPKDDEDKDEFQELSEMFNLAELDIVRKHGGRMHREHVEEQNDGHASWHRPRLLLKDDSNGGPEPEPAVEQPARTIHGRLSGVYTHYLLVRPYPSMRILFTSPSLRVPGILQSPFMNRIGSSDRVRDELVAAFAEGRGVTAKIRWVARSDDEGRNRWIHCTPLLGGNGNIGVWMVVLVDDEKSQPKRRFRPAPPVAHDISGQARDRYPDMKGYKSTGSNTSLVDQMGTPSVSGRNDFDFRVR